MKILFILSIGFDTPGPAVHLVKDIIREMLEAGHTVNFVQKLLGGSDPVIPIELEKYIGSTLIVDNLYMKKVDKANFVKRYIRNVISAFDCAKVYKKYNDVDIVFVQSNPTAIFPISLAKKYLKKPVIFDIQDIFPQDAVYAGKMSEKSIIYKISRFMQKRAYMKADHLTTISKDMKKTILEEGISDSKIDIVYNWSYSNESYDISDDENLFLKIHPEIDKSKYRVVYAGNIGAMVNVELMVETADKLRSESGIHFYIIGEGSSREKFERLVREKDLPNITFYPLQTVEYAPHNYSMANINLIPLPKGVIYTVMPSKTATALACGKPIIAGFDLESDMAEILRQVDKCTVLDPDDVNGYVDTILEYYRNGIRDYSANSRDIYKERFSQDNAKQYVKIFEKVVSNTEYNKKNKS
jgi:Glycosyltransferase